MPAEPKRIRLFISYSHRDQELRAELDKQLSPLKRLRVIDVWHDRQIDPGQEWDREIKRNLEEADIILLLISADFMASEYAWSEEMKRALERHEAGEARVIPVILQPCDWEVAPFAKIQALPRDAKAVSTWGNRAEALADVARGVRIVAQSMANNPLKRPVAPTPEEPEVAPKVRERQQAVGTTTAEPSAEQIEPKEIRTNPSDGQPYVWIPPGEFQMGCSPGDNECDDDEKPRHAVKITRGFWLGQTAVTVAAYRRFVEATGIRMPDEPVLGTKKLNPQWSDSEQPMVAVTWEEAKRYCESWAKGRLPTEAEWEYAARAGSAAARYGELDAISWYANNSGDQPLNSTRAWEEDAAKDWAKYEAILEKNGNRIQRVKQKQPNPWGLYDMLGNVLEWVGDWYEVDYYRKLSSPAVDPKGPTSGTMRVLRGGSWYNVPRAVRASNRDRNEPEYRYSIVGFRCVREVIP